MGLFDKKYCDICGKKIGLLGNRKLKDGNMCKDCAKHVSLYLTGRKQFKVDDMKEHLAYREENRQKLEEFSPTRTIGTDTKLYIDDNSGQWLISRYPRYKEHNPDILTFDQVTGCSVSIDESKRELKRELPDGKETSYNPPRYRYSYDFRVEINVNNPWFSEIGFQVNRSSVGERDSIEFRNAENQANEIRDALTQLHEESLQAAVESTKPRSSVKCPFCGAVVIPDENGKCPFCDSGIV